MFFYIIIISKSWIWFDNARLWSIWENGFLCSSFKSSSLFNNTISWRDRPISEKCEQLVRISLDYTNLGSLCSRFLFGSILDLHNFISHLRYGKSNMLYLLSIFIHVHVFFPVMINNRNLKYSHVHIYLYWVLPSTSC